MTPMPARAMLPVRALPVLAAYDTTTTAGPVRSAGPLALIQDAPLAIDHAQLAPVVTVTDTDPAAPPTLNVVVERPDVQAGSGLTGGGVGDGVGSGVGTGGSGAGAGDVGGGEGDGGGEGPGVGSGAGSGSAGGGGVGGAAAP